MAAETAATATGTTATMTSTRRHSRAPLRRSSTPEKIVAAGLATATCVGLVGVIGARTVAAQAADDGKNASIALDVAQTYVEPTTSSGLTQADLEAYAAQLASERVRLDTYRAKLIKAGKQLQHQAAQRPAQSSPAATTSRPRVTGPRPVAKPPRTPAPRPAAKPVPKPAPHHQSAPAPQSNTKSS